jgi:hypothetical protein
MEKRVKGSADDMMLLICKTTQPQNGAVKVSLAQKREVHSEQRKDVETRRLASGLQVPLICTLRICRYVPSL